MDHLLIKCLKSVPAKTSRCQSIHRSKRMTLTQMADINRLDALLGEFGNGSVHAASKMCIIVSKSLLEEFDGDSEALLNEHQRQSSKFQGRCWRSLLEEFDSQKQTSALGVWSATVTIIGQSSKANVWDQVPSANSCKFPTTTTTTVI